MRQAERTEKNEQMKLSYRSVRLTGPEDDFDKYENGFSLARSKYVRVCMRKTYKPPPKWWWDVDFGGMGPNREMLGELAEKGGRNEEGDEEDNGISNGEITMIIIIIIAFSQDMQFILACKRDHNSIKQIPD